MTNKITATSFKNFCGKGPLYKSFEYRKNALKKIEAQSSISWRDGLRPTAYIPEGIGIELAEENGEYFLLNLGDDPCKQPGYFYNDAADGFAEKCAKLVPLQGKNYYSDNTIMGTNKIGEPMKYSEPFCFKNIQECVLLRKVYDYSERIYRLDNLIVYFKEYGKLKSDETKVFDIVEAKFLTKEELKKSGIIGNSSKKGENIKYIR